MSRGGNGFSVRVNTDLKAAMKRVNRIRDYEIVTAKRIAFKEASQKVITAASREIAARAGVPYWMIRGVGGGAPTKKSGARLGRSGYIKKVDGVILFLRHTHINPAGTVAKPNVVRSLTTGGVSVRGVGTWRNAVYQENERKPGAIYERLPGHKRKMVSVDLEPIARTALKSIADFMLFPVFRNRFTHQIKRATR